MIVNIAIFFMTVFISTDASAQSTRSEIFYKKIDEFHKKPGIAEIIEEYKKIRKRKVI